jgi:polyisoprenoid-binding protein YceI
MKFKEQALIAAAAAAMAQLATAAAEPIPYEFDKSHTAIRAWWVHWGFTRQALELTNYDGVILLDFEEPKNSKVYVTFHLDKGYWVGDPADDRFEKHLASADLFDIARFPTIAFKATSFETSDGKTGVMRGDLTIKGRTLPVALDVKLNRREVLGGADRAGFSAATKIDRSDWGLDFGLPNVCCEVEISIETELVGPPVEAAAQQSQ